MKSSRRNCKGNNYEVYDENDNRSKNNYDNSHENNDQANENDDQSNEIDDQSNEIDDLSKEIDDLSKENNNKSKKKCYQLIGKHEIQILEGAETDINTANCKKNPGHSEFIPIEQFSLEHLPEDLRDSDLYEFIKTAANMTVRISVNITSPHRPEFFPDTQAPYPLYEKRGEQTRASGSGRVRHAWKFTDDINHQFYAACPCDDCKVSDKPSKVFWEISVETAAHVVFDNIEASQTTLRLFFDNKKSPLVILKSKVCADEVNIEKDRCKLSCVTCDETVGNKLDTLVNRFASVWKIVYDKFHESRDLHKFSFIVSHPHGCSKQVSVGRWEEKIQVGDDGYIQFTYRTCTCTGSSGAYVHFLGYNDGGWYYEHVHSGTLDSGLNLSGAREVL